MTTWLDILSKQIEEIDLDMRLKREKDLGNRVYPSYSKDKIFRAFYATPWEETRVVILGEDTPTSRKHATGLAFAAQKSTYVWPEELTNISKELHNDIGKPLKDPSLESWASQGVLLLNTHLTSGEGEDEQDWGWDRVTRAALDHLNLLDWPIVFILWGKRAQYLASRHINNPQHKKIVGSYPSNRYAIDGFFGTRPFTECNNFLKKTGETIEW